MIKITLNGVTFTVPDNSRVCFISDDAVDAVEMDAIDAWEVLRRTNPIKYPPRITRGEKP